MLRRLTATLAALALGAGAAFGVAACGEDRGSVEVEGGGTGKTGATGGATVPDRTGATGPTTSGGSTTPKSPATTGK